MGYLILLVGLSCPVPQIYNKSGEPITREDKKSIKHMQKTCKTKYKKSPCLIKVLKKNPRNWWACCGKPDSKGDYCGF